MTPTPGFTVSFADDRVADLNRRYAATAARLAIPYLDIFGPLAGDAAYRADYTSSGWAMNTVFDGVTELLTDLRDAGVRLAVATSKAEPTARRILEHFEMAAHFEVIAGASLDGTRAAKAEVLAHALTQLEPLPERVLMVGDRAHDVEGAAEHGIATVVVGWGYGGSDFLDPHVAGRATHVTTIDDLREALGV